MNTPSLIGPLLAFGAVVAAIPLALWLFKRTPMGAAAVGGQAMRLVATLPLAPNQRLVTVEVGSGDDRRWLVLGVTPGAINTLHSLPPQTDLPATGGAGMASLAGGKVLAPFAQLLAGQRKNGGPDAR